MEDFEKFTETGLVKISPDFTADLDNPFFLRELSFDDRDRGLENWTIAHFRSESCDARARRYVNSGNITYLREKSQREFAIGGYMKYICLDLAADLADAFGGKRHAFEIPTLGTMGADFAKIKLEFWYQLGGSDSWKRYMSERDPLLFNIVSDSAGLMTRMVVCEERYDLNGAKTVLERMNLAGQIAVQELLKKQAQLYAQEN